MSGDGQGMPLAVPWRRLTTRRWATEGLSGRETWRTGRWFEPVGRYAECDGMMWREKEKALRSTAE